MPRWQRGRSQCLIAEAISWPAACTLGRKVAKARRVVFLHSRIGYFWQFLQSKLMLTAFICEAGKCSLTNRTAKYTADSVRHSTQDQAGRATLDLKIAREIYYLWHEKWTWSLPSSVASDICLSLQTLYVLRFSCLRHYTGSGLIGNAGSNDYPGEERKQHPRSKGRAKHRNCEAELKRT